MMTEHNTVGPVERADEGASDAQWVRASLAGSDPEAFSRLVRRYLARVTGKAAAILRDPSEAQDVAQEAFVKAYRSLAQLKEPERFGGWLMMIAVNTARRRASGPRLMSLEFWRKSRDDGSAGQAEPEDESAPSADRQAMRREVYQEVLNAMEELPDTYRNTVYLRYVGGRTCREIADIEGVGISVVTSRLSRAYDLMRTRLVPVLREGKMP